MTRLIELYKKTKGGHAKLSDDDFKEYAGLRKQEFQDRKTELMNEGKTNIKACKDYQGDITGWTFEDSVKIE